MLTRLTRRLYPVLLTRDETATEANLRRALAEADETIADLRQRLLRTEEELEAKSVECRIQVLEIQLLSAINKRNIERVREEGDNFVREPVHEP